MSCAACSSRVEKAVSKVPGVTSCSVSLLTNSMGVEGTATCDAIISAVEAAGYHAEKKGTGTKGNQGSAAKDDALLKDTETPKLKKRLFASVGFLLVLMYFSMGHMMWNWPLPSFFAGNHVAMGLLQLLLTVIIMVINQKFFISGFKGLLNKSPNMDTLVALGSGASFLYSVYALFAMTDAQVKGDMTAVMAFVQGVMNSCNPVFIEVGQRLGTDAFYRYFQQFGLLEKTGIDLPGEAGTIMHQKKDIGPVELATISFGQSFQITPIRLAATVCSLINGGHKITPHFGVEVREDDGTLLETLSYKEGKQIVSEQVSKTMRMILEKVVSEGGGKKAYIEGYHIGGKTATSETLPRSANKYISSFLGFVPAEDPRILGICIINNPQGVYYGGTICAPVMRTVFENILPYLGIEKEAAQETDAVRTMDQVEYLLSAE